jgi:hypothetical protein
MEVTLARRRVTVRRLWRAVTLILFSSSLSLLLRIKPPGQRFSTRQVFPGLLELINMSLVIYRPDPATRINSLTKASISSSGKDSRLVIRE